MPHQEYNAANQVDGFTYDNAGNLIDDGMATYGYDALGRMTGRDSTTYAYNGDGALVSRVDDSTTTYYIQDLAAPLTQVLQTTLDGTTTNALYGLDRLAAQTGSARTWYVGDALGSVRMTLDDAGAPLGVVNYDPWGTPERGDVPTFGFTGELQDSSSGMVNLRARWYSTGQGRFGSRDPFAGYPEQPYGLHQYAYGFSDPVLHTDPSGRDANGPCKPFDFNDPFNPATCKATKPPIPPKDPSIPSTQAEPSVQSPFESEDRRYPSEDVRLTEGELIAKQLGVETPSGMPADLGFIEGVSASGGSLGSGVDGGIEQVFDLWDFEIATFYYGGSGSYYNLGFTKIKFYCPVSGSVGTYIGAFTGWGNYRKPMIENYEGPFQADTVGGSIGALGISGQSFGSVDPTTLQPDRKMHGVAAGVSAGNDRIPAGGTSMVNNYTIISWTKRSFHGPEPVSKRPPTETQTELFAISILATSQSPLGQSIACIARENGHLWRGEATGVCGE